MRKALWLLFALALPALAQDPVLPAVTAIHPVPTTGELSPPESLRPCCAFGYDLHVRAVGIPIPVYQIGNVLTLDSLGKHHYNDSALGAVKKSAGTERGAKRAYLYPSRRVYRYCPCARHGGLHLLSVQSHFADAGPGGAHILQRRTGVRRVQLNAFTPPPGVRQRYQLAAWLAGHLAFEIAQWHEIAQWYGFQSVPGFSEEISAFSPEDLYSNLLGARLAINVILSGHGGSVEAYNRAMEAALKRR